MGAPTGTAQAGEGRGALAPAACCQRAGKRALHRHRSPPGLASLVRTAFDCQLRCKRRLLHKAPHGRAAPWCAKGRVVVQEPGQITALCPPSSSLSLRDTGLPPHPHPHPHPLQEQGEGSPASAPHPGNSQRLSLERLPASFSKLLFNKVRRI